MRLRLGFVFLLSTILTGCLGMPKDVTPVTNFDLNRYLGTWHEVARLDHSFERGLSDVTATYSLREDGGVKVINRGFSREEDKWQEAEGKAYFVENDKTAYLKVSFFGPFYGSYVVFELDDDYQYAFISGPDHGYLWLLSRTPTVPESVKERFISEAKQRGFATEELIFVDHARTDPKQPVSSD